MNITDVDDKTIKGANEHGMPLRTYTDQYIEQFTRGMHELQIEEPDVLPRVADNIDDIIAFIQKLLDRGYAYESDGSVYFRIKKSIGYGALALLDTQELKPNASLHNDQDEYEKENIGDFALWKAYQKDDGDIFWESPFGRGRPGWHIECTVLAMKYLGEQIDIHTGGIDLIFPHHTNEIAQAEGVTEKTFAKTWLHNAHLFVEGKKMSKSSHNFLTLEDVKEAGIHPLLLRYLLLRTHFQHDIDFSLEQANEARQIFNKFVLLFSELENGSSGAGYQGFKNVLDTAAREFSEALDDNLNMSNAMRVIFELGTEINKNISKLTAEQKKAALEEYQKFDMILGIFMPAYELYKNAQTKKENDPEIQKLLTRRREARSDKDYATADQLRDELLEKGVAVRDTSNTEYILDVVDWI